jgi:predicted nucleotidyltransferase
MTDPLSGTAISSLRVLARSLDWRLVVLFGSVARDGRGRDLDLAVLPGAMPGLLEQGRWQAELEGIWAPRPVDLVLLGPDTSPVTRFQVFRDGRCLFEAERGLFERERDRACFLHADSEHFAASNGRRCMSLPGKEVLERKLGFLNLYLKDLAVYGPLDPAGRRREHYAIERLLQLLCESAADIALQFLKAKGETLPAS